MNWQPILVDLSIVIIAGVMFWCLADRKPDPPKDGE